jgi:hypothetical protein
MYSKWQLVTIPLSIVTSCSVFHIFTISSYIYFSQARMDIYLITKK